MNWKALEKKELAEQFRYTLATFPEAARFILRERLWEGFWRYGWFSRIFTLIAVLIGLSLISDLFEVIQQVRFRTFSQSISSMGSAIQQMASNGYDLLTNSGSKFFMLVLLEVIIFHASRRTLELLSGESSKSDFNHFVKAQFRMFAVGIYAWVMTMLFSIPVKIAFGFLGFLDFLQPTALFLVQAYFMGFTIVDNYSEQYELSIGESARYANLYPSISLAVGIVISLLLWVPIAGPLVAPLLAAVAATMVLYAETPLHLAGQALVKKKKKKKKKKLARTGDSV